MGRSMHVIPLRDAIAHHIPGGLDGHDNDPGPWLLLEAEDGDDMACPCGVTAEHVPSDTSSDGWLYTHHSLDGRERYEVTP